MCVNYSMLSSRDYIHMLKMSRLHDQLLQNVQQNWYKMSRDSILLESFQIACTSDQKCCKMSCDCWNESIQITTKPVAKCPEQYIAVFSTLVLNVLLSLDTLIRELAIF